MDWWASFVSSAIPATNSIPKSLLAVLLLYSFASQFHPIEPYLVPYLISCKKFTNFQITVDIFPIGVYSQLIFTLLIPFACYYLSQKITIVLGAFGLSATYMIIWYGESLIAMQVMQVMYGFGMSAQLVFSSYIFLVVIEEEYQAMTSLTMTVSLFSFMLASEVGQLLTFKGASYGIYFIISLISLGACCGSALVLPKDHSLSSIASVPTWNHIDGWAVMIKKTWNSRTLQILSAWWAVAYAGISLVQNYGTILFDAIDSESKLNGHILAASVAAGSLGSYFAIYVEKCRNNSCQFIYVLGSVFMGILCVSMGASVTIWLAYAFYVGISGIYQMLACLVTVQCGRKLSNGQFILLLSVNNFAGLLIETLLQAAVEAAGFSVFSQFRAFSGLFFLAAATYLGLFFISDVTEKENLQLTSETETDGLLPNGTP